MDPCKRSHQPFAIAIRTLKSDYKRLWWSLSSSAFRTGVWLWIVACSLSAPACLSASTTYKSQDTKVLLGFALLQLKRKPTGSANRSAPGSRGISDTENCGERKGFCWCRSSKTDSAAKAPYSAYAVRFRCRTSQKHRIRRIFQKGNSKKQRW